MKSGRLEYRAAKVSVVTGLSTVLSVGFQLVSVPICLKFWGAETYGGWLALYAAFMMVRSLDSGFVSYVGNKLNYLFHQDQAALREHLASAVTGIAIIGSLQLVIGLAAVFLDGIALLLGVAADRTADLEPSLALLVLISTWILSGAYLGIVHRLLIPTGFMHQAAWWSMGFQACQFGGIILAAIMGFNLFQTSVLFALIQSSVYVASGVYARLLLPDYYPWWRGARMRTGIGDLCRSVPLTASNVIQQASVSGTVVLVSALAGPALVPAFTTVRTLANLWLNVSNVLTTPLLPDVVRLYATGQGTKLVKLNEAYLVVVGSTLNFGILIAYPFIEAMYGMWTAHAVALDRPLLSLLLCAVVVTNMCALVTLYLSGMNRLGIMLATSVIRGAVGLGGGWLLYFYIGLSGFALAIFAGELLAMFVIGDNFFRHELRRQGVAFEFLSLAPALVSSGSVIVFLVSDGFDLSLGSFPYPVALLSVATAALWGWHRLPPDIRARLAAIGERLLRRPVA